MNSERVTPKNAAKELQMDVITLRELMKREKLPIGYAIKREGKSKWGFYIYRHLLDQEKERLGMEITPIDDLMAKANETEKMKGHINEWRRMLSIQEEVATLQKESNSLTEKIELARTLPGTILETAEIPIEGLSVKDGI